MEGVGSRLGRASSRYGPSATVFSGPVRKWKKKWVHVSQSRFNYHSSHSQSNGSSRLLLCRWTPISPSTVSETTSAGSADEPPRRKFRYTPIAVLEEQKKAYIKHAEDEGNKIQTDHYLKLNIDEVPKKETQESDNNILGLQDSNISHLDLGLCLKGHNSNVDSVGQNRDSSGVWSTR
ncbi:hypothetical protein F2P56_020962 [Juglans regia]|uniref:Uncharacterized protein n=2 Tax=Juglans regia TaxID=51240 RepID=A0A833UV06_JUGRE|nr:uncharacterized protein LOC108994061 isoform X1 [Juglans regia]KAF5461143.1 hypothetical protein F2P56_020962 [Juglans regia]